MNIIQLTPQQLLLLKEQGEESLKELIEQTLHPTSWMNEWQQIATRFQLLKLLALPEEELQAYSWNEQLIEQAVIETVQKVAEWIPIHPHLNIIIVPAKQLPWFKDVPQALWTNGFTNSSDCIWIALPKAPDIEFLRYLIAHELHHASPSNPIYSLTNEHFPLKDWYKMEGAAEYFSLQLYEDKRWWKDTYTEEIQRAYIQQAIQHLHTVDPTIKMPLCYGDAARNLPIMIGYIFAFEAVKSYVSTNNGMNLVDLFELDAASIVLAYEKEFVQNS